MAQRLATEYVKASLELTEAEMLKDLSDFSQISMSSCKCKVLDNGNHEMVFRGRRRTRRSPLNFRASARSVC